MVGLVAQIVTVDPKAGSLPGTTTLLHLADGVEFWALLAAGLGVMIGAVMWAFGHYSHNFQQAYAGRRGVVVSALAGLLIGAGPKLVGIFYNMGTGITK